MVEEMAELAEREAESDRLEAAMAEVCGVMNVAAGRLVRLVGELLASQAWQVSGMRSVEQWVSWKCGVSPGRAHALVAMARRLEDLTVCASGLDAGELSEDQLAVIARHAPAHIDAEVAELARHATVAQLGRVLRRYSFDADTPEPEPAESPAPPKEEPRHVRFGHTEAGSWQLCALLPSDEGALVERALEAARNELFEAQNHDGTSLQSSASEAASAVSWADALLAMAEKSLAASAVARPYRDRHLVLLHLRAGGGGHLHLGPGLEPGLRHYLSCDARVRTVVESEGKATSVGRAFRIVPDRTRMVVEDRDGGCRVPGCTARKWLHVHHIVHWSDGGATDTANLLALCSAHHRMHHRGCLGISGDADEEDGVVFTDERGRRMAGCGRPAPPPPGQPLQGGKWVPPAGEPLEPWAIYFNEPAGVTASSL